MYATRTRLSIAFILAALALAPALLGACKEILPDTADHYTASTPLVEAARMQIGVTTIFDTTYKKIEYPGGDIDSLSGGGGDVIVRAFRRVGIDLQRTIHEDKRANPERYPHL